MSNESIISLKRDFYLLITIKSINTKGEYFNVAF